MRSFLAGFFLLLMPAFAFAQAKGEVESIGFNNSYRPDAWTPMVVRLRPETNEPGTYQIQVWQHDIDGDRPVFTRQITLNGADQAREQRFWMYFLPQPIDKGLPDPTNGGTLKDLQRELPVFLCTASGKQITQLPITSTLLNVDPVRDYAQQPRSAKLLLAISDGTSTPAWRDYESALGLVEDVVVVNLQAKDLPEDPIGYEGVDAIVWLNADPADLDRGGAHKLATLQDYVRSGGHLVVTQPTTDWQKILGFADMLPVTVLGVEDKNDLEPLRSMAKPLDPIEALKPRVDQWLRPVGPFQFAKAKAKSRAVVEAWIDWHGDGSYTDATPYIARSPYGLGAVTWVAQDLGNPAIAGKTANGAGWPYVWDKVFGWKNDTYVPPPGVSKDNEDLKPRMDLYRPGSPIDLGYPLTQGLNLDARGAFLIFIAVAFFFVYLIVAGPGSYLYLASKKRARLSWFFFGGAAIAATLLTVAVVKAVMHYPPQLRHLTVVRVAPGQPTYIYSRFGLYITHDGDQSIELTGTAHDGVSYLSGYAEHPQQLGDVTEFPAPADYTVPVRDIASIDPPALTVPYRSSLKKFQAKWIGDLSQQVGKFTASNVKMTVEDGRTLLSGAITNQTNNDFNDVYIAYHGQSNRDEDRLIYIPLWKRGVTLDLQKDLAKAPVVGQLGNTNLAAIPGDGKIISDEIGTSNVKSGTARDMHWIGFWYRKFYNSQYHDANTEDPRYTYVYPMLSLFDRLPPAWNKPDVASTGVGSTWDRFELYRRGGRMLNVSQSLMAGQLAILASAQGPLPMPMEINGDKAEGQGTTFYQFLLPIDRGDVDKPTTQPAG